jgi:hypothetical protein
MLNDSATTIPTWALPLADQWQRLWGRIKRISPEVGDALLYGVSALFALLTISTSTNALYQVWGRMALLPFAFGAIASAVLAWAVRRVRRRQPGHELTKQQHRRAWLTRIIVAALVFAGALAIPMGFEILWRFDHVAGSHQQPEVVTVEVGGQDLVHDKDPYIVPVRLHHPVKYHPPGQPDFEGFLPYLPVMAVAGIPSEIWPNNGLSDARIFFCLTTLGVAAVALYMCRADGRRKIRAIQALIILPLASLPLATGGDDIPVVAFLLLAIVLAQRQRPFASGVVFGVASAMKFTAWPLAALALFAAYGRKGERRPFTMLAGMVVVAVPTIFPFALRGPFALIDDVVLFPLGLSKIPTTAASALPGHVLVSEFPSLSRALPLAVGIILAVLLARHLYRRTPSTAAEVCMIAGVVMAALIILAPAPRIGYLLYPINFMVWAYLLAQPAPPTELLPVEAGDAVVGAGSS